MCGPDQLVLPPGMDALGVIAKPSAVARLVAARKEEGLSDWPVENLALKGLLDVMAKSRKDFTDYAERKVGPDRYRLTQRTKDAYAKLEAEMPGDFIVIPIQTGLLHRGESVRHARAHFAEKEFGLCAFAVGCIVLTHPERLTQESLWIDCAGSEFAPGSDGVFSCYSCWCFGGGGLEFDWDVISFFDPDYGSASGSSPEC